MTSSEIRCREIREDDIDNVVKLLHSGFPIRPPHFWLKAFARLTEHPTPVGYPKYGYLLERNHEIVGTLLLIFSTMKCNDKGSYIRCGVSSWYVEPAYRGFAPLLSLRALRHQEVTYVNITPGRQTFRILELQGYRRYGEGQFIMFAALGAGQSRGKVRAIQSGIQPDADLTEHEIDLLLSHASYGCISVTCTSKGRRHPFVFIRHRWRNLVPVARLAYCRDLTDFCEFAGSLGRFLLCRGLPLILVDANGRIPGFVSRYWDDSPKYFKGPHKPRPEDLAFSECAMFGV